MENVRKLDGSKYKVKQNIEAPYNDREETYVENPPNPSV
jgi:hypothetical protein